MELRKLFNRIWNCEIDLKMNYRVLAYWNNGLYFKYYPKTSERGKKKNESKIC